jgi:hypothetical protein
MNNKKYFRIIEQQFVDLGFRNVDLKKNNHIKVSADWYGQPIMPVIFPATPSNGSWQKLLKNTIMKSVSINDATIYNLIKGKNKKMKKKQLKAKNNWQQLHTNHKQAEAKQVQPQLTREQEIDLGYRRLAEYRKYLNQKVA